MRDIMLRIVGKQIFQDMEEDQIEFITEGKLYERGDSLYLIYEESEVSGVPGCKTSLKVTGNKIRMKRSGKSITSDTAIEFQAGKKYFGIYSTPYGAVEMEVLTNSVDNKLDTEGKGSVDIDYHISLRGLSESRSKLNIEII